MRCSVSAFKVERFQETFLASQLSERGMQGLGMFRV